MPEQYVNKAQTTLNNGGTLSSGAASLVVTSATAFPTSGTFRIIIDSEIIIVGAVSGTTFSSLTRGAESTTAVSHADGSLVTYILTAASLALVPAYVRAAGSDMTGALGLPSYTFSGLPTPGLAGRIARTSDGSRGLWMDTGTQWYALDNQSYNVRAFGAKGDAASFSDAAITSGLAVLTSSSSPFTSTAVDGGKKITVSGGGASRTSAADGAIVSGTPTLTATATFTQADVGRWVSIPGAGAAGAVLTSRILRWCSATVVILNNNAGTTVTGKVVTIAQPLVATISTVTNANTATLDTTASSTVTAAEAYFGTDDTAAMQAAINALPTNGGVVQIPPGYYFLSSALTVLGNGVRIQGAGQRSTTLYMGSTAADGICFGDGSVNPNDGHVSDLWFFGTCARTAGAAVHFMNGHSLAVERIRVDYAYYGVLLEGGNQQYMYTICDFEITNGARGILIDNVTQTGSLPQDVWIRRGALTGQTIGLEVVHCGGGYFQSFDVLYATQWSIQIGATAGKICQWLFFYQVVADTSQYLNSGASVGGYANWHITGASTGLVKVVHLAQCWGASANSNGQNHGLLADFTGDGSTSGVIGLQITGSTFLNNGGDGILITGATTTIISNNDILSNSQAGSAAKHGIEIGAGVTDFLIANNRCGPAAAITNLQSYGIVVNAGGSDYYLINGNILTGNVTAGMIDAGNGTNKQIYGNLPDADTKLTLTDLKLLMVGGAIDQCLQLWDSVNLRVKSVRISSDQLQVINHAFTQVILALTDAGNLQLAGSTLQLGTAATAGTALVADATGTGSWQTASPSSSPPTDWTLLPSSYTSVVSDSPLIITSGNKVVLPSGAVLDLLPDFGVDGLFENSDLNQDLVIPARRQAIMIGPYIIESNNMLWLADSGGSAILSIVP